jgi:hypothetical protein
MRLVSCCGWASMQGRRCASQEQWDGYEADTMSVQVEHGLTRRPSIASHTDLSTDLNEALAGWKQALGIKQ